MAYLIDLVHRLDDTSREELVDALETLNLSSYIGFGLDIEVRDNEVVIRQGDKYSSAERLWQKYKEQYYYSDLNYQFNVWHNLNGYIITICLLTEGRFEKNPRTGTAICAHDDAYDENIGRCISFERAMFGEVRHKWLLD